MAKMFQDDNGNTSSMRVAWFITIMVVLFVWSYVSIKTKQLASLSPGDAMGLGFLMLGKAGQKLVETRKNGNI